MGSVATAGAAAAVAVLAFGAQTPSARTVLRAAIVAMVVGGAGVTGVAGVAGVAGALVVGPSAAMAGMHIIPSSTSAKAVSAAGKGSTLFMSF